MIELLHLSDIHFGPRHRPEVSAGVLTLLEHRRPHLVIISGDLTHCAKPVQFREAKAFRDAIEGRIGVPTLAVPGNHDVPMYRVWERIFRPYGAYRRHYAPELEPTFDDDNILALGVNSAFNWTVKDGRVTRNQLRRLDQRLAASRPEQAKVIVIHHPLVPAPRFDNRRVVGRAVEMAALFAEHRVDAVLAGHFHQAFISTTEAYYPSGRVPVPLIHSGTSTSSRGRGSEHGHCTANWLRIDAHAIAIERLGWSNHNEAFVRWSEHRLARPGHASGVEPPALGPVA